MKNWTLVFFIFILNLSFDISAQENKNVLLISSYNSRFPTYFEQINGIKSILDTTDVNLDVEFMDSKRFISPEIYNLFYKSLKSKLANSQKYDAILTADDDAFNFVLQYQDELFKNIPIIFFGVNDIEKALKQNSNPNVTGVVEAVSMKETIELMVNLFPETGSVYCISDGTSSGLADLEQYREISKQLPETAFKEVNLSQLSFSEYKVKIKTIPSSAPVLLLSSYRDKMHKTTDFDHVMSLLQENLDAPLFHLWEHGMGNGVFGGKLISHFEQGKIAAEMVYSILFNKSVSKIKIVTKSPNILMFDYNQLNKHNIELNKLPNNAIILNKPITFWEKHKLLIVPSLIVLLALLILILVLSGNIIKRKKIEYQLKIQNKDILKLNSNLLLAKQKAEEGEEKFKQLFYDHTAVKLLICAETGQIFDANPAAAEFYGWSLQKLCQMNIGDINTLSFSEIEKIIPLTNKNRKVHYEFKHRKADGTIADVEVFSSSVNISEKIYLYSIVHDVSEKKKQEHRISLLSRSIEQSPIAIVVSDKKGIIEYVNPAFTKITGYSYNEAIGKNPRILKSKKTSKKVHQELWNTINSGNTWQGEIQNKKANGDSYWVSMAISPIYENNELTNFVAVSEDITEKRKTFEDLVKAKEKAQESDQLKSAFLANMSHEIRTPMNGILGFAGLLKERELSGEKQKKYIEIIEKSGDRMLNIINDIINISKIESGIMDVHFSETNINNQLQFVYDSLKLEAGRKNLQLSFTCAFSEKDAVIKTDSEKFYGILSNLVKNAIKYTLKGTIEFGYDYKGGAEILFYVKDTGVGISKEQIDTVFERFIQADITDTMAHQGAGLGLAISKAYVEMLGGKIWVESTIYIGSTFFFTIPWNMNSQVGINNPDENLFKNIG
ncbi:PAS domain S-box protein [Lutibacter sp. A80]|uniref:ABC transporter substrate binding protein n=1 Tax=Lutibacter sp. A80 TaxID=2918453 RepID=UPI001F06CAD5|nr:ABC transporter substrate binding protein [Lutibacter sp. A80]UMB60650.1 PAS domain S-box protein [Lutibacter sp. A80]